MHQRFRVLCLKGLLRVLSRLPLRVLYGIGHSLGRIAGGLLRYRRKVVDANLERCFPQQSPQWCKDVRRRFYRHLGEVAAETVWFGGCRSGEKLHRQRLVYIESMDEIRRLHALAPDVVILQSHSGNWELTGGACLYDYSGQAPVFTEANCCVGYLRQSSPVWNEILHSSRIANLDDPAGFEGYLESREMLRYALSHAGQKKIYFFITDQRPYFKGPGSIPVDFMGVETQSMKGGASIACKLHAAVLFLSFMRDDSGAWRWRFIPICEDASQTTPEQIMQQYYNLLQADIQAQPWNWLWSHRRWKQTQKSYDNQRLTTPGSVA